jgi:aspartate kinase
MTIDDIYVRRDMALVMLVGEGMQNTVGISSRATRAFAGSGVNLEMINQGASEVSIVFGIDASDSEKAVKALYNEFFTCCEI